MRIGIDISVLSDRQKTGIAVYTYNLIDALLKKKGKDKFVLFGIATFETYDYLSNLHFKNYPNVEMRIYKMPARLFRVGFLLWQLFDKPKIEDIIGKVDIFHSFNWYFPLQKFGKRVAAVFDMTSLLYPKWHQDKTVQLEKVRLNRIKKDADLVITISDHSKKDYLKFAPGKYVEVIYPAVSEIIRFQKNKKQSDEILKKYNLTPGYFLSVGTLEPRKNIEGLIKAYLTGRFNTKLVLVGSKGWKNEQVFNLLKMHKDKIIVTGFVPDEDLGTLYSQALCLVYPSFYEGFGIPMLEAQACGCPVITSNTSSMPEIGGKGAIYVDPYNVADIVKGMERVKREGERVKLIKAGFENVKRFSWEVSAEKLKTLYQQLVRES